MSRLKNLLTTSVFSASVVASSVCFADDTPQQQVINAFKNIDFSMGYAVISAVVSGIAGFIVFQSVVKRALGFIRRI